MLFSSISNNTSHVRKWSFIDILTELLAYFWWVLSLVHALHPGEKLVGCKDGSIRLHSWLLHKHLPLELLQGGTEGLRKKKKKP